MNQFEGARGDLGPDKTEPENCSVCFSVYDHFSGAKSALDQNSAGLDLN